MIHHGHYREALAHVTTCDAVITDPPYGRRTHEGQPDVFEASQSELPYAHWEPEHVHEFVEFWAKRCTGWIAAMTSHDLVPVYEAAYKAAGRYGFAPVPILQHRPRQMNDGPGSGTVYLMVCRPREKAFIGWGSLPCWYTAGTSKDGYLGGKPLDLMRAIVRDYSRAGQLVVDPCAGSGTTLLAALDSGRLAVGSDVSADAVKIAAERIAGEKIDTTRARIATAPRAKQPRIEGI